MEQLTGKTLVSLALIPLFFFTLCASPVWPARRGDALPNHLVYVPDVYPDNYILTQLFYSAFHMDDLAAMQNIVSQGILAYPNDFPRFMALTLELAKKPDSRLFMLLTPLAPYVADQSKPADLASVVELTNIFSGKSASPSAPSLRDRIKFYEDEAKVVRPRGPAANQPEQKPESPAAPPGGGESMVFTRLTGNAPRTRLLWTKDLSGGHKLVSEASDAPLPDGGIWGGVRISLEGADNARTAYFSVNNGIIAFAGPRGISEADFYADQTARPHLSPNVNTEAFALRPDGAAPRPCDMHIQVRDRGRSSPPELFVQLEQLNAGLEYSDFLCRAQCVLSYSWDGHTYSLSGKACTQSGWGVWPYSDERFHDLDF